MKSLKVTLITAWLRGLVPAFIILVVAWLLDSPPHVAFVTTLFIWTFSSVVYLLSDDPERPQRGEFEQNR